MENDVVFILFDESKSNYDLLECIADVYTYDKLIEYLSDINKYLDINLDEIIDKIKSLEIGKSITIPYKESEDVIIIVKSKLIQ